MAYSKIILNGETLMDVTSDTVDAGNLLSGKTATKNSGTKVTGNIATKSFSDLTVSGATVTAPAGYYSTAASKAVTTTTHPNPTAAITSSTGVVTATHTQGTGYVTGGTTTGTLNLTTQAAQTINTSTADQTIASNRWLIGAQTIKSVTTSNLTAANIASGVIVKVGDANNASRITQVTGTYAPAVSSLTITPTETAQTFNATGVYGYKPVTVNAISSTYVGTGIATRSAANLTASGSVVTAPAGYYSSQVTKSVASATLATPAITLASATGVVTATENQTAAGYIAATSKTSTYTLTTQAAQTLYPSTATRYINSYRWLTGSQTIASVTTSNLTAENIAEGVTVKVGDATNASRITQITGIYSGEGTTYTATIMTRGLNNTMGTMYNYVKYSNVIYYLSGSTFDFHGGDSLDCLLQPYNNTNLTIYDGDGNVLSNATNAAWLSYTYTLPNNNLSIYLNSTGILSMTLSSPTIFITSNGMYDVVDYTKANVNVTNVEGGFTADQIAMRTISGDISGSATNISNYAFFNCYSLTTANFPNATSIGVYAFASCSSLTTVSFPSVANINNNAFGNCSALTIVSFPNVTSIGDYAFASCSSLTTANFPNAISIGARAFYNCYSLTTANFPNVISISDYAFNYCYSLTTANFPKATTIGIYAFASCYSLTTVSFPNVANIYSSAFRNCYNLLSFYLLGSSIPILSTSVFRSTPIDGYTNSTGGVYGSIFVPSSLYNSYITATNWSLYSARIVSV